MGSIAVSISAFQADGPGSTPGLRIYKMEEQKEKKKFIDSLKDFYDKRYRLLFVLTAILIISSVIFIFFFHLQTNDFIYKDISLSGGTLVTINSNNLSVTKLQQDLSGSLGDIQVNSIKDMITQEQKAVQIQTTENATAARQIISDYLGYNLTNQNSSFEFTSPTLGSDFYQQLILAILIAFVFMSIVVFILFRTFVPSGAVVLSAFADILMTLVVVDMIGMRLSSAGIIAFLMLIGYSVDTDILLTNKSVLRDRTAMDVAAGEYGLRRLLLSADAGTRLGRRSCRPTPRGAGASPDFCRPPRCVRLRPAAVGPLRAALNLHPCCAAGPVRHLEYFHDHVRVERMLFDGAPSRCPASWLPIFRGRAWVWN